MRFLHTSDWHLGRTLHGVDLHDAQRAVLTQLCALVTDPPDGVPIDAVLVAGDIYDRAVPPVESVSLLAEVLATLARHTTVIVISGNHDSAIRLGFGSAMFTDRIHIRTGIGSVGDPVIVGGVAIYPLPYLDPDHARLAFADPDAADPASANAADLASAWCEPLHRSHQAVLDAAMRRVHADLATRPRTTRSVVMAHVFVANAAASDSERPIAVGGVDTVRPNTFDGVDYVALGHLHGHQEPPNTGSTVLHYSGSPLRYSFSERNQAKSVTMVDLDADGAVVFSEIPLTQPRPMAELRGTLDELLSDPALSDCCESWLRVTVTDRARPDRLFERVRSRFPFALQVLHLPPELAALAPGRSSRATEQRPAELATDFVRYVTGTDISAAEIALFEQAYEAATADAAVLAESAVMSETAVLAESAVSP